MNTGREDPTGVERVMQDVPLLAPTLSLKSQSWKTGTLDKHGPTFRTVRPCNRQGIRSCRASLSRHFVEA